jgi:integrase
VDVDLVAATIKVHRSMGQLKGGRLVVVAPMSSAGARMVTIPRVLVDELGMHLATFVEPTEPALLFVGPKGATPKRGNWRKAVNWTAQVRAAELPDGFHFHDLRHTERECPCSWAICVLEQVTRIELA